MLSPVCLVSRPVLTYCTFKPTKPDLHGFWSNKNNSWFKEGWGKEYRFPVCPNAELHFLSVKLVSLCQWLSPHVGVVPGRITPWPCSCGRAGTMTACPTITPTRRWGWTVDLWTSCGFPTLSSSTPNLLGSTMSPWRTSWSVCSPTESFYTAAGTSQRISLHQSDSQTASEHQCSDVSWPLSSIWVIYFRETSDIFGVQTSLLCCLWEWKSLMIQNMIWEWTVFSLVTSQD